MLELVAVEEILVSRKQNPIEKKIRKIISRHENGFE